MFNIEKISKSYGNKLVLDNISLSVAKGEAVGILGINGSGKSTLLSCIAKKYAGDGSIKIGYMPQENPLFDELNAIDNIKMWTKLSRTEIITLLNSPPLSDMGISDFARITVKKMSGGMKKRVSLAIALINNLDFCRQVYLLKDGKLMDADALINKGISYVDILRSGI